MSGSILWCLWLAAMAAAGVYGCRRARSGRLDWRAAAAMGCGLLALTLVMGRLVWADAPVERAREQAIDRQQRHMAVCMTYLGRYLTSAAPEARVLLISNDPQQRAMIDRALRDGADGRLTVGAHEIPPPPTDELAWAQQFVDMVVQHRDCDVVITLIGLPRLLHETKGWSAEGRHPKLIVVNADLDYVSPAVRAGAVVAAVVANPAYNPAAPLPSDVEQAFHQRFLLIDRRSIGQMAAAFPHLFASER